MFQKLYPWFMTTLLSAYYGTSAREYWSVSCFLGCSSIAAEVRSARVSMIWTVVDMILLYGYASVGKGLLVYHHHLVLLLTLIKKCRQISPVSMHPRSTWYVILHECYLLFNTFYSLLIFQVINQQLRY